MPASQLKRLKASLREQKEARKKQPQDRARRNAALQQIRDSFNPFEVKAISARPEKFSSAGSKSQGTKYKDVLHRPGVTKSVGEEMRKKTLLPEMRRRNKVGGLIDRRIGEGDTDMTPEERAVQRFAKEKERKVKGRTMFDLEASDDEKSSGFGLTHGGRRLDELAADDFDENLSGGDESADDGELFRKKRPREEDEQEDTLDNVEAEEGPERKKTKKEVMDEVIAKSKYHKYERQKAKEDDDDLRMELDQGMGELMSLLHGKSSASKMHASKPPESSTSTGNGPTINPDRQKLLDGNDRSKVDKDYDIRLKQLANDARAKPSDRTLTAEEKMQQEADRLRDLEDKRQKRMSGQDVSEDEEGAPELNGDEDIPDQAAEFGFTTTDANSTLNGAQLVLEDEDEFALDDTLVANDSEIEDVELSDEESSESDEDDAADRLQDEENEFVKGILGEDIVAASGQRYTTDHISLPYTYPCPRSQDELLTIIKDKPIDQLPIIIQRIRKLYQPSLSESNKESVADFSRALIDHLAFMGDQRQSLAVSEQVIRHLHSLSRTCPTQIGEQFRKHLAAFHERGQPSAGDLVLLTAIGSIYPTSDHWHQVVTPATTVMAKWLSLNVPSKIADDQMLNTGALLVTLCSQYQRLSKRYIPEALRFTLRALACKSATTPHLANLLSMADLWKDKLAFIEIFTPALPLLKALSATKELQHLSILMRQSSLHRRPLELHHHRAQPIRTSVPKFEENFNPDKHYDPDKERSDAKKLQKEVKREKKGAMRELRKDANFMAREQLREKRERDAEYEKKQRRLIAEIQAEEGREANSYAREKARRTRKN